MALNNSQGLICHQLPTNPTFFLSFFLFFTPSHFFFLSFLLSPRTSLYTAFLSLVSFLSFFLSFTPSHFSFLSFLYLLEPLPFLPFFLLSFLFLFFSFLSFYSSFYQRWHFTYLLWPSNLNTFIRKHLIIHWTFFLSSLSACLYLFYFKGIFCLLFQPIFPPLI